MRIDSGNKSTDKFFKLMLEALNGFMMDLAQDQIRLAFEQSEKEVADLRQRTREGLVTAALIGKRK